MFEMQVDIHKHTSHVLYECLIVLLNEIKHVYLYKCHSYKI